MTAISCISLVCPVGYSPESVAAALRARIPVFEELHYRDRLNQPLRAARVDAIPPSARGRGRLALLARLAVENIDRNVAAPLPWGQMPFLLCTRDVEMPGARISSILGGLTAPNGAPLSNGRSVHVAHGQISAFVALEQARKMLRERGVEACLIMAIDSLIDARALAWLDSQMRLRTSEVTDGLIPGEGASILVVSKRPIWTARCSCGGLDSQPKPQPPATRSLSGRTA